MCLNLNNQPLSQDGSKQIQYKTAKTIKTREITRLSSLSDKCRIKTKLKTIQLHLFDTNRKFP